MSILYYVFCPQFATLPLDFGGRLRGHHFTYDVAPTLNKGQQSLPPPMEYNMG